MSKDTIFFDLDGTILDVSERVYQVYKIILKKYDKKFLSKKEYINLKKNKEPIVDILKKTGADDILSRFNKEWAENIEKQDFLSLDKLSSLTKKFLLELSNNHELVLVTLRDSAKNLKTELQEKKIENIFDKILVKSGKGIQEKWKIKYRLIKEYGNYKGSIFVGDTETDILAGKELGLKTIAVTSGMRSRQFLEKHKPDLLVRDIFEINNIF